jgi:hypothetical protein
MMMDRRNFLRSTTLLAAAVVPSVNAQQLETARIFCGFPPGSTPDTLARRIAEDLRGVYANAVLVENRTGVSGQLAVAAAKAGKADGSTLLLTPMAMMSVYPFTYRNLPYDPIADFAPVSRAVVYDRAFSVGTAVPQSVKTIPEFLAWAKANPTSANFGSPAVGSPLHFTGIFIGRALGVELQHVAYRGTIAAIPDLASGRLPAYVSPLGDVHKFRADGKVRILGTSGVQRSPFTPDVMTFAEQGIKGLEIPEAYAFFVPAKTPPVSIAHLNESLRKALNSSEMAKSLRLFCMEPSHSSPAELGAEMESSMKIWGPLVKSTGFTIDT